jgi:hypothetical protein
MLDTTEDRRCNNQQLKENIVLLFIGSSIAIIAGRTCGGRSGVAVWTCLQICHHHGLFYWWWRGLNLTTFGPCLITQGVCGLVGIFGCAAMLMGQCILLDLFARSIARMERIVQAHRDHIS